MFYIGIDPGSNGAISIIDEYGSFVAVHDMPMRWLIERKKPQKKSKFLADGVTPRKKTKIKQDTRKVVDGKALFEILSAYSSLDVLCAMEFVSSKTGQGVKSMFSFGESVGCVKGVLESAGIKYRLVSSAAWQGHFQLTGGDKDSHKQRIMDKCRSMYPDVNYFGSRGGLKDGRSDAILISRYYFEAGDNAIFVA